jgi:hypothetical protein
MKKVFIGVSALLLATMVFMSCGGGSSGPVYKVTVSPAAISMAPGAVREFTAVLTKDGVPTAASSFTWTVANGDAVPDANTKFNGDDLTIAPAQAEGTLIVTASIDYDGGARTGTATVTVLSQADVDTALSAISSAADAATLLAALKAPNVGINPALVVDANSDAYFGSKTILASAASSDSASVEYALMGINGTVLMEKVNAATNASEVQNLFNEATFKSIDFDEGWTMYSALGSGGKVEAAKAIYNSGTDYSDISNFQKAVSEALNNQYMTETAPQLKSSLDAVLGTNPTLAQINAFLAKIVEFGADPLTVTESNLSAVKDALTAAKTEEEIKTYLDAGNAATPGEVWDAVTMVYFTIGFIVDPDAFGNSD